MSLCCMHLFLKEKKTSTNLIIKKIKIKREKDDAIFFKDKTAVMTHGQKSEREERHSKPTQVLIHYSLPLEDKRKFQGIIKNGKCKASIRWKKRNVGVYISVLAFNQTILFIIFYL